MEECGRKEPPCEMIMVRACISLIILHRSGWHECALHNTADCTIMTDMTSLHHIFSIWTRIVWYLGSLSTCIISLATLFLIVTWRNMIVRTWSNIHPSPFYPPPPPHTHTHKRAQNILPTRDNYHGVKFWFLANVNTCTLMIFIFCH